MYCLTGDKPVFCCDDDQASLLMSGQIEKAAFTRRCPLCYVNFAKILIHMSCDPNHREFLKVTASATAETDPKKQMLTELKYYMSRTYVDNAYNSCVSVQAPSFGSTVIKPLCGNYGAEHCSPDRWVESIGTKNPSPFQINFHLTPDQTIDGYKPMNQTPWSCKEAPIGYSNQPCSCADCPAVCPFQKHSYPEPDTEWTVWGVNGMWICMAFVYLALLLFIISAFVISYYRKRRCGLFDIQMRQKFISI